MPRHPIKMVHAGFARQFIPWTRTMPYPRVFGVGLRRKLSVVGKKEKKQVRVVCKYDSTKL
jgi:hypothetical protein